MAPVRYLLLMATAALLAACAGTDRLESSGGTAIRIDDDIDALAAAMDRAEDHCDRYGRDVVLQGVSSVDRNDRLATFACVEPSGGGIALFVGDGDEDVREASREADAFCGDMGRVAVLQSISEIDNRRVAAFDCARA